MTDIAVASSASQRSFPGFRLGLGAAAVATLLLVGSPGYAQDRDATILMNRVQQLEQEVRALQGGARAGGGGPAAARMEVRQSQYEEELRSLTGRVEDLAYEVRQLGEKLDKLAADVDYRIGNGGGIAKPDGAPPSSMGPPPPAGADATAANGSAPAAPEGQPRSLGTGATAAPGGTGATATAAPTPRQEYAQAYDRLRQGQYEQAADAFAAFISNHPDDPLTDNARYWLGESFYARGDYARATEIFVDGYQKNKGGAKAPDTLLKLGMSLAALGKTKEACATFRELGKSFADASSAVKDKAAQEARRAGCS